MRSVRLLALACLIAAAAPAHAQDPVPAAEVVSSIEATYRDVAAISASFTQTVSSPAFGESVQKGTLEIKRPKMARWEFTEPQQNAVITNGQTLWIWSPADNQVIVTEDLSGSGGGASELMVLLTDLSRLDEFFTVETIAGPADQHTLKLTPKDTALQGQFSQLELALTRADMLLRRVTFGDSFGQTTRLDFAGVQLRPTIADDRFSFQPPAGATVINSGEL